MANRRFFTANQLKAIALFCMLLDHMVGHHRARPGMDDLRGAHRVPHLCLRAGPGLYPHPRPARLRQAAAVAGRRVRGAF